LADQFPDPRDAEGIGQIIATNPTSRSAHVTVAKSVHVSKFSS